MSLIKNHLRWLVLIFLGLVIYGQSFGYGFVFDDFDFIVNNPYIKRFDHVHYIWKTFPHTRTLGFYSFALNYHIDQLRPQGYHIFNFLIHLLATGLVWACAKRLFKITQPSPSRDWVLQELPFIIAVLFLVHPCQTQAVTYISQRFESLATVFYLSTILCYLCARTSSNKSHQIILFLCTMGFAILGLLTKEVAITIPLTILAVEMIIFKRDSFNRIKNLSRPSFVLIILLSLLFIYSFTRLLRTDFISEYFNFSAPSLSHDGDFITGGTYALTQMRVFLTFMRLLFFPINQNLDYDYPLSTGLFDPPLTFLGVLLIGVLIILILRICRQWPLISFGLAWILITFSVNTAPRTHVIYEHKLYLISFGFFLSIVCFLSTIIKDRKLLLSILVCSIAVLSFASFKRNQVWQNQLTLWSDVVQKSPHKAMGYNGLGVAYFDLGNLTKARDSFSKAIALNPYYEHAYNGRGNVYSRMGDINQALSDFNRAIMIKPNYADAYYNRGVVYDKEGGLFQALSDFNKAIDIDPDNTEAYYNRGNVYAEQMNFNQALSDYNKAIEENPNYEKAFINRGNVYCHEGVFDLAIADYDKAIDISPSGLEAYVNRGTCYAQHGNLIQALSDYNKAITINPKDAKGYYNRSVTNYQLKDYDNAWKDLYQAQNLGAIINPRFIGSLKAASAKSR